MAIRERELVEPVTRRHPVRRVAKWVVIVLAVTVVAIALWWVLASTGKVPAPEPITVAAPAAPAAPVGVADGCADPRAVQSAGSLDATSAARLALTYVRWASVYPAPSDASAVLQQVVAPVYQPAETAILTRYASGVAADGFTTMAPVTGTATAPDLYRVVAADPANASITVTVVAHAFAVKTVTDTATVKYASTVILDAVDGRWLVAGKVPPPTDPYAPITGVPWVSFDGLC